MNKIAVFFGSLASLVFMGVIGIIAYYIWKKWDDICGGFNILTNGIFGGSNSLGPPVALPESRKLQSGAKVGEIYMKTLGLIGPHVGPITITSHEYDFLHTAKASYTEALNIGTDPYDFCGIAINDVVMIDELIMSVTIGHIKVTQI